MRKFFAFMAVALFMAATTTAFAVVVPQDVTMVPRGDLSDVPARAPDGFGRADTIGFGYYTVISGTYYAVQGETWTWDHIPGGGPNYNREGWYAVDTSDNGAAFFKRINSSIWAGHTNQVAVPVLHGTASAWAGIFEDQAAQLCWEGGLGYGNKWCQQFFSPTLHYTGTGDLSLDFYYFNDTELNFDYSKVYLHTVGADPVLLNPPGFTSQVGINAPPTIPTPTHYTRSVTQQEIIGTLPPGAKDLVFYFELTSDGGWSDEDGAYVTAFGPFGLDDFQVTGNVTEAGPLRNTPLYDFESGLQGWTADKCQPIGSFFSIQDISDYNILDPCACALQGKIVVFHDPNRNHPRGQYMGAFSPRVRKSIEAPFPTWNQIMADWDMYAELPQSSAVFYRPGFWFYPYVCPNDGHTMESGRQGQSGWFYVGDAPACFKSRNIGTNNGIPPDCQVVGFVFEVYSSCDAFNVHPCPDYTQFTNFTPAIDNVQIRFTGVPNAPVVGYDNGTDFQDNFPQGDRLDVRSVSNADITYDLHRDPPPDIADKLGDSLMVAGSLPTSSTKFLSRLWFRVKREGPGQVHVARYRTWKAKVSDGINIVGETSPNKGRNFAFGWMDSVEVGTRIATNKFCSQFSEADDDFTPGGTSNDQSEDNEIIWDNMLTPGTKIQYFTSCNYLCTPNSNFLLPDTAGQNYSEFEILPSYRNVTGGLYKYPCILYVDAFQSTLARYYIQQAFNVVLNHANIGDPIPDPTSWDRYDYQDATSNWMAPMFRNTGGNAGGGLLEFLGYRFIMVNTGTNPEQTMRDRDWQGFAQWMTATDCVGSPQPRQGFWANGDDAGRIINSTLVNYGYPAFFTNLGAFFDCDANWDIGCPTPEDPARNDTLYCTKQRPTPGGPWAPTFDIENFGNWCPAQYPFDVLGTAGSGAGNKNYQRKTDNYFVSSRYSQVVNDQSGSASNYRTVLDGYSISHIIRPDLAQGIPGECQPDTTRVIQAILDEITHVMTWTLGAVPTDICVDPCTNYTGPSSDVTPVQNAMVTRLYQNSPNPFNPRTTIRFSLAADAPAKLVIYDVNGRKVKTLVNGAQKAGLHELVWDGTDDAGHAVSSGIFWSQLTTNDYTSNKKMVVLK